MLKYGKYLYSLVSSQLGYQPSFNAFIIVIYLYSATNFFINDSSKLLKLGNAGDCPNASGCCLGYFSTWVASLKKRDDILDLMRGERFHDGGGQEKGVVLTCLHLI